MTPRRCVAWLLAAGLLGTPPAPAPSAAKPRLYVAATPRRVITNAAVNNGNLGC